MGVALTPGAFTAKTFSKKQLFKWFIEDFLEFFTRATSDGECCAACSEVRLAVREEGDGRAL